MFRFVFQYSVGLCASSGGVSFGAVIALTAILIPALQEEENEYVNMSLEQGAWLGERTKKLAVLNLAQLLLIGSNG